MNFGFLDVGNEKGRLYFVSYAFCLNSALYERILNMKRAGCATNTKVKKTQNLITNLGLVWKKVKPLFATCNAKERLQLHLRQEIKRRNSMSFYSRFDVMNLEMKVNL